MVTKRDYYEVLGVARTATETEIKRAFRNQARKYHPDVNKEPDAEARFKEINEAYEVLSDPRKRAAYDRFGHGGAGGSFEGFSDLGGFADIFETFFGAGTRRGRRGPQRGADLRHTVTLSFEEAVFGVEKEIDLPIMEICHTCDGSGAKPGSSPTTCPRCQGSGELRRVQQSVFGQFVNVVMCETCQGEGQIAGPPCPTCGGSGRERGNKMLTVKIPAGVDRGQQIRLVGEGEIGPKGGPPGDLYVVLDIQDHPLFTRDGTDLYYSLALNVAQAALGHDLTIRTLDGNVDLRIPPGTQNGARFTIRGKGVPQLRGAGRGNLYVIANVEVPTKLTGRQRELFEELAHTFGPEDDSEDRGILDRLKEAFGG